MREVLLEREVLSDEKGDYRVAVYSPGITRYYRNGKLHRDDGPAWIYQKQPGRLTHRYYQYGKMHRNDGPAECTFDKETMEMVRYEYYVKGRMHCITGPADWNNGGWYSWWFKGMCLGRDKQGFWELWGLLTDEQRNNLDLLMWLPRCS